MLNRAFVVFLCGYFLLQDIVAQEIPSDRVLAAEQLYNYLKPDVKKRIGTKRDAEISELAQYFREQYSKRYFYDWKTFNNRFETYKSQYKSQKNKHFDAASDHMSKYAAYTKWKLPFEYLNGTPVNAYALRHLARQHKMVDIAFVSFYKKDSKYVDYFTDQQSSLNNALHSGKYEFIKDGNGIYEAFRSGYRVLNWLQIHQMYLSQESYSDQEQLQTISTLLQHGAHLYENNQQFTSGNHQTRGVSALAMISILLRDFKGTDKWYEKAMSLLEEHLKKEINQDGFQFERTIHYHISDIENYFFVYQLAKINNTKISPFWEAKLESLFTTLVKIAYPDKSAPVLSDDTNQPWAEKNDISEALTLGYLIFNDAQMGYFANKHVSSRMFWYISDLQLEMLKNIKKQNPKQESLAFQNTGYYIMRNGFNETDQMLVISAGVDDLKPDHQHGDILGIQAMSNKKVLLPNYQVRYYLDDLELFKNSLTKNVALVDELLQGQEYTSNKGGSGFGKFKKLPKPIVLKWETGDAIDVFVGSHDGFESTGVSYNRQLIYLKNDFWIVKDNFKSKDKHVYKQVWQGHYSEEHAPNLLRATFDNGSGMDLYQLRAVDENNVGGSRGKQWNIISKMSEEDFSFITLVYPYNSFDKRIDETQSFTEFKGWELDRTNGISLSKANRTLYFSVEKIHFNELTFEFDKQLDVLIEELDSTLKIKLLSAEKASLKFKHNGVAKVYVLNHSKDLIIKK